MFEWLVCLGSRGKDPQKLSDELTKASFCIEGNTKRAKRLLRQGACPNGPDPVRDEDGNPIPVGATPLVAAGNNAEMVRLLMGAGADPDVLCRPRQKETAPTPMLLDPCLHPYTALDHAVITGSWEAASILLEGGANPLGWWSQVRVPEFKGRLEFECDDTTEADGTVRLIGDGRDRYPPLVSAMVRPQVIKRQTDDGRPLVRFMTKNPQYLEPYCEDESDVLGLTLWWAITQSWFDLVEMLLERGKPPKVWASASLCRVTLQLFDENRYCRIAETLLKCGADPNYSAFDELREQHPLTSCALMCFIEGAKLLISYGSDVDLAVCDKRDADIFAGLSAVEIAEKQPLFPEKSARMVALLEDRELHRELRAAHLARQEGPVGDGQQGGSG